MAKLKSFIQSKVDFPSHIRHTILSWLMSVAIEYFKLPRELRDLSRLDGLAQMSLVRIIVLTFCFTIIFFSISCFIKIAKVERWGIATVFALIAAGTLL